MSYRNEKFLSLLGKNLDQLQENDLQEISRNILDDGLHGICFSLYEDGQEPGNDITDEQIIRRLQILKPHTEWIRTFSSLDEHGRIAQFAKGLGFKTLVGAWLSIDKGKNEEEINGLIDLSNAGFVDVAAVGNEVIYRKELDEESLVSYINNVKQRVNVPVGYVDAYYEFRDRPNISDACDVILANCYPFWEVVLQNMR